MTTFSKTQKNIMRWNTASEYIKKNYRISYKYILLKYLENSISITY